MQRGRGREDAGRGAGVGISPLQSEVTAIIAAGGRGDRAETSSPKQFASLGDRPLVSWSIDALHRAGCSPIVLVVPVDFMNEVPDLGLDVEVQLVRGGPTRQQSVANGLNVVETDLVLVHDAARPFVDEGMVDDLSKALDGSDGVVPVVPVKETVKELDGDTVARTVDRANLFLSQTPQLFRTEILRAAHEKAETEDWIATDDAQLVEWMEGTVTTVPGSRRNIKVTYPEDFEFAEKMVSR